jgi:CelD/BcsL family acetyltransferase involved in cellulose biosynthesis
VIEVEALRPAEDAAWDAFVVECDGGVIYYSSRYRDLLVDELGCEAEYLVAREGGEIRGVLPVMWSENGGGRVLNSLPYYGSHGAPLAKSHDAERALIDAWSERATDSRTLAATMVANPFRGGDPLEPVHDLTERRIGQVTMLPSDEPDELMSLYSKRGRRDVRRAERRGVEVGRDPTRLFDLWRLHDENMGVIGGLAKSERFFTELPRRLEPGRDFDLWVASKDGEMIAGLLVLYFQDVAEYWTPAVEAAHRDDEPMALTVFQAMLDASQRGCRLWNWGGTWSSQDGVYRFKRKWGAEDRPYRYFVRVNDRSILEATPEQLLDRFPHFYVVPFSALQSARSTPR